jgi:hypothetical protein
MGMAIPRRWSIFCVILAAVTTGALAATDVLRLLPFGIGHRLPTAAQGVQFVLYSIVFIFLVILLRILFRWRSLHREQQAVTQAREAIRVLPWGTRSSESLGLLGGQNPKSLVAARFVLLSSCPSDREREDRAGFLLSGQSSLDEATIGTAFQMDHALVWALPVLGFIGTAFAMALTVSGFSVALGQGPEDFQQLRSNLVRTVIPHLSQAFDVTLVALSLTVVAYICLSFMERGRRAVVVSADETVLSLLAKLPAAKASADEDEETEPINVDKLARALGRATSSTKELAGTIASLRETAEKALAAQSHPRHFTVVQEELR